MPLYNHWKPNEFSEIAIWHIEESESYFFNSLATVQPQIKHPKRRIEYLAGRYLLKSLKNDFDVNKILINENSKPYVANNEFHFSLSHSYPFVTCITHEQKPVGIDIQCKHDNVLKIQNKFLSKEEQMFTKNDIIKTTLAWTAKEAAFKYQNKSKVDFIKHLQIIEWYEVNNNISLIIKLNILDSSPIILIKSMVVNEFCLSFIDN